MKVFLIHNHPGEVAYSFLSDSAVSNTGKPFYLPENLGETRVSIGAAIRINRLGKGVKEKFSSRYYSEAAPALHFFLPDFSKRLKDQGLPDDAARNFDKSLFVGEFRPFEPSRFVLKVNEDTVSAFDLPPCRISLDKVIEEISRLNTLKMGDYIVLLSEVSVPLEEGDTLRVVSQENPGFHVRIK